jgi:uncharacterized membrane protein HdeD (DUF308 family)
MIFLLTLFLSPVIFPQILSEDEIMFIGLILIIAGILLILSRMDIISGGFWDYFWPIILIALGGKLIFDRRKLKT